MNDLLLAPTEYPFEFFIPELHTMADVINLAIQGYQRANYSGVLPPSLDAITMELYCDFQIELMNRALAINDIVWCGTFIGDELREQLASGEVKNIGEYIDNVEYSGIPMGWEAELGDQFRADIEWALNQLGLCYANYDGEDQEEYNFYEPTKTLQLGPIEMHNGPIKGVW